MNEDYTLPSNTNFTLHEEPIPITVILQNDGMACEGLETINLTISPVIEPVDDHIILEPKTVVITLKDIGRAICHQNQTNILEIVLKCALNKLGLTKLCKHLLTYK